ERKQSYDFSQPDWSEFFDVLEGNGPASVDRIEARQAAWEDGAWVREARIAHAEKKNMAILAAE
ncbi:MAG: 1,2-phenylacetyl-CoA epoxidase subunit A, partial [Alphaproteobacteria bacterium]|nr:1,2-phenylacetyl-CoA epoxidase subunit A [Alphaproteobacteria bacterium]